MVVASTQAGMHAGDVVQRGLDFEVSLAELTRRSERRAWRVSAIAALVATAQCVALVAMLPLKQSVPFLVIADAASGTASVARLEGDALDRRLSASEALNRANVAQFIHLREGYDHAAIRMREWRVVHSMSGPEVAADYKALYDAGNPASPDRVHGRGEAVRVRILSIVLVGGGNGRTPTGATVRFQRSLVDKRTGKTSAFEHRIATLAFRYEPGLRMDDIDRLNNPLGFQVTSYRTDRDYAGTPMPDGVDADTPVAGEAAVVDEPVGDGADTTHGAEGAVP